MNRLQGSDVAAVRAVLMGSVRYQRLSQKKSGWPPDGASWFGSLTHLAESRQKKRFDFRDSYRSAPLCIWLGIWAACFPPHVPCEGTATAVLGGKMSEG